VIEQQRPWQVARGADLAHPALPSLKDLVAPFAQEIG
jgi:hypothetical protein